MKSVWVRKTVPVAKIRRGLGVGDVCWEGCICCELLQCYSTLMLARRPVLSRLDHLLYPRPKE